jgi:hypothetical protein
MELKNAELETFETPEGALKASDDSILVEIGLHGILRVFIVNDEGDIDTPIEAHRLLADVMPQLLLLDSALKSAGAEAPESR